MRPVCAAVRTVHASVLLGPVLCKKRKGCIGRRYQFVSRCPGCRRASFGGDGLVDVVSPPDLLVNNRWCAIRALLKLASVDTGIRRGLRVDVTKGRCQCREYRVGRRRNSMNIRLIYSESVNSLKAAARCGHSCGRNLAALTGRRARTSRARDRACKVIQRLDRPSPSSISTGITPAYRTSSGHTKSAGNLSTGHPWVGNKTADRN
jgi:hypothetical protein